MVNKNIYNNQAELLFSNDFLAIVTRLLSCCYIMFNYFLGYWSYKLSVKESTIKLMGLDSLLFKIWDNN